MLSQLATLVQSMKPLLQTLAFTIVVPGSVAGYIPWLLRAHSAPRPTTLSLSTGIVLIAFGVTVYAHTAFWGFAFRGRGTPAPIAPTQNLVISGLHRYIRNPMYIGVLLIVAGQAVLFDSRTVLLYAAFLWLAFHVFVLLYEEPALHKQFGPEYDNYKQRVPRWLPKL